MKGLEANQGKKYKTGLDCPAESRYSRKSRPPRDKGRGNVLVSAKGPGGELYCSGPKAEVSDPENKELRKKTGCYQS